jgi:hypothetical protein
VQALVTSESSPASQGYAGGGRGGEGGDVCVWGGGVTLWGRGISEDECVGGVCGDLPWIRAINSCNRVFHPSLGFWV